MTQPKTKRAYNQQISVVFDLNTEVEPDVTEREIEVQLWTDLHRGLCRTGLLIKDSDDNSLEQYEAIERGYKIQTERILRVTSEKNPHRNDLEIPIGMTLEQRNELMDMAESTILILECEREKHIPLREWVRQSGIRIANNCIHDNTGVDREHLIPYFTYMRKYDKLRFIKWWNFISPDDPKCVVEWNGFNMSHSIADNTLTLKVTLDAKDASYFGVHQENINKVVHWVSSKFLDTGLFKSRAVSCAGSINATVPVSCEAITNDQLPSIPDPVEEEE